MSEQPSTEPKNVQEAIVAVMRNVGYVQKVRTPGLNYSFASEADLIAALRPHMVAVGLIFSPVTMSRVIDQEVVSKAGGAGHRVVLECTWIFLHAPSNTHLTVVSQGEGIDYGDKASNKAMTTALKYALRQTFLIETGDDPDATPSEALSHEPTRRAPVVPETEGLYPGKDWTPVAPKLAKALKAAGIVPQTAIVKHILNFLSLSPFGPDVAEADLLAWGHLYRAIRDEDENVSPADAAKQASEDYFNAAPVPRSG